MSIVGAHDLEVCICAVGEASGATDAGDWANNRCTLLPGEVMVYLLGGYSFGVGFPGILLWLNVFTSLAGQI